ncbi:MAG TPA: hypothetical protein VHF01_06885 [Candidatus Acidoferrum sp.]|nr:hypothetical protein [Candidatus Acidoferrum sp.]
MATVSLQNVVKDYLTDGQRVRALDGLSLEVSRGEFVALGLSMSGAAPRICAPVISPCSL